MKMHNSVETFIDNLVIRRLSAAACWLVATPSRVSQAWANKHDSSKQGVVWRDEQGAARRAGRSLKSRAHDAMNRG
eukprot:6207167-Pleurochrysis_carterae.AAC.3